MTTEKDQCSVVRCRNESSLCLLGVNLCGQHWEDHCHGEILTLKQGSPVKILTPVMQRVIDDVQEIEAEISRQEAEAREQDQFAEEDYILENEEQERTEDLLLTSFL